MMLEWGIVGAMSGCCVKEGRVAEIEGIFEDLVGGLQFIFVN